MTTAVHDLPAGQVTPRLGARAQVRLWRARLRLRAQEAAAWRISRSLPGLGGIALVSAGAGGLVGTFAGAGGWWAGLLIGGAFLLRIDSRV